MEYLNDYEMEIYELEEENKRLRAMLKASIGDEIHNITNRKTAEFIKLLEELIKTLKEGNK